MMNQATIEKVNAIILAQGVTHVEILPNENQVWITVTGHENTGNVVKYLEEAFFAKADLSAGECWAKADQLYYQMISNGLIISINGHSDKPVKWTTAEILRQEA